eukprot:5776537-Prymnesium_polylepis.1
MHQAGASTARGVCVTRLAWGRCRVSEIMSAGILPPQGRVPETSGAGIGCELSRTVHAYHVNTLAKQVFTRVNTPTWQVFTHLWDPARVVRASSHVCHVR